MPTATEMGLLEAKLRPPRAHVELVNRRSLVSRLLKSTEALVLISAPAGSGKTIALAQWARRETRPVAWLRLDDGDNDPVTFLSYLVAALDTAVGMPAEAFGLLEGRSPSLGARVVPGIAAAVTATRPFVLVLDDAQLLRRPQCWRHVEALLDALPEGGQIALATREDPPLPLARLRAQGQLAETRFAELAFDKDETAELLRASALDVRGDVVAALLEATEGWATGLYLALLTGREPQVGERAGDLFWPSHVHGDQKAIAAYLLDEVVARQPRKLRTFLMQTSILDTLSAPLCAAVTGRADSGAVLAGLAAHNLFVTTTGETDEWYRYHHLFAELLRSRLEREADDSVPGLHRRAAAWYEAHGDRLAAITHFVAAGEIDRTPHLVGHLCDEYLATGRMQSVRSVLGLFTEEQLLSHPGLAIAAGWGYAGAAGTSEEQRRWTSLMSNLSFADGPATDTAASLRSSYTLLMAELAPHGLTRQLEDYREAAALETVVGSEWYETVWEGYGLSLYLNGRADRARRVLGDLLGKVQDAGDRSRAQADLALIAADEGRWDEARAMVAAAKEVWPELGLEYEPGYCFFVPLLLAHLRLMAHRDDPETGTFLAAVGVYAGHMVHRAPWYVLWVAVELGRVALQQGDLAVARGHAAEALGILAGYPDAGILGRRARQLEDALERRAMAEPLTPAEKRVLELLPTLLSYEEIAQRLFLSKATVKSHLRVIYRKLEVTRRADAVTRAREIGLLED